MRSANPHRIRFAVLVLFMAAAFPARAETPPPAPSGDGIHYVYMIRHGIYDRDSTATDDRVANGLNALGREQARLAGERLAALPIHFDRLVSSEFLRAAQTADEMGAVMKMKPTLRKP